MKLTLQELMDNYDWDKVCEVLKLNPWCINEGLATGDSEEEITVDQARKIGILPSLRRVYLCPWCELEYVKPEGARTCCNG